MLSKFKDKQFLECFIVWTTKVILVFFVLGFENIFFFFKRVSIFQSYIGGNLNVPLADVL
jgi:hypothetical protein